MPLSLIYHFNSNHLIGSLAYKWRFDWPNASPEIIEQQASTPIEGILATLKELKSIRSSTYPGYATIQLEFDQDVDLDMMRFEAASLIRHSIPKLPKAISYPRIFARPTEQERERAFLTYTLQGDQSPYELQRYAQEVLSPELSRIAGIRNIEVYGASPNRWVLSYNPQQWQSLKIDRTKVSQTYTRKLPSIAFR